MLRDEFIFGVNIMKRPAVTLLCIVLLIVGCQRDRQETTAKPEAVLVKQSREVMGTFAEITAVASTRDIAQRAVEAAYARLSDVNRLMSAYQPDSEISRLNRLPVGESIELSPETFYVLKKSVEIAQRSNGTFDITCKPIINLWKQAAKNKTLPTDAEIRQVLDSVGCEHLKLDESSRKVSKTNADVEADLGGIAKGYSLDLAAVAMKDAGATSGLVNVGGDVFAWGTQAGGDPWRIGVQNPFRRGITQTLTLKDRAVATSGVQQRFFEIGGQRYSHIIDPRSGQPAAQSPSVTVIAPEGLTADAWATAFSVLTVEEGKALCEQLPDVEVLWLWGTADQPQSAQSAGFQKYVLVAAD